MFPTGVVTYANETKVQLLNIPQAVLAAVGAVSPEVARAMAERVRELANTTFGVGITGIAGPGGGTEEKPVGLVYIAVATPTETRLEEMPLRRKPRRHSVPRHADRPEDAPRGARVRLFLAVELSEKLLLGLEAMQARLRERAPDAEVRWSSRENFHLTVLFLGSWATTSFRPFRRCVARSRRKTTDFRIRVAGGSAFPKPTTGKPLKTLWVGLAEGGDGWKELALRAEPWFTPLGAPKSDGLVPHVTLGRVKAESVALREALAFEKEAEIGLQQAGGLSLIESVLTPQGALYTHRGHWTFSS